MTKPKIELLFPELKMASIAEIYSTLTASDSVPSLPIKKFKSTQILAILAAMPKSTARPLLRLPCLASFLRVFLWLVAFCTLFVYVARVASAVAADVPEKKPSQLTSARTSSLFFSPLLPLQSSLLDLLLPSPVTKELASV